MDRNSTSVIDIIAESQNTSEYTHIVAWASMCKSTNEDSEGACPHSHQPPHESPPRQFRNLIQALVGPRNSCFWCEMMVGCLKWVRHRCSSGPHAWDARKPVSGGHYADSRTRVRMRRAMDTSREKSFELGPRKGKERRSPPPFCQSGRCANAKVLTSMHAVFHTLPSNDTLGGM